MVKKIHNKPKPKMKLVKKLMLVFLGFFKRIKQKVSRFLSRRPHRSFRITKRRDYIKKFKLPGYIAFTKYTIKTLWTNKKKFLIVILIYALAVAIMVGITSQDFYESIKSAIDISGKDSFNGFFGEIEKSGLLFLTAITGGINEEISESQQIYAGILAVMAWLTNVWLLRNILAERNIKVRDAIYSAGAPIIPTLFVSLLLIIQMIPIAIALFGYGAALSTGLLDGGVEAMMFWTAAILLAVLSLYWITSTLISLVVVTLPGMYPYQAIKIGGDLVVGRRLKILIRLIWMIIILILIWAITLIPIIMIDGWLKGIWPVINWIPIVPLFILLLGSFSVVWVSSYVYLFYRKVVADDAKLH